MFRVFFFQAEDGIRDIGVTGVQTCALPICSRPSTAATGSGSRSSRGAGGSRAWGRSRRARGARPSGTDRKSAGQGKSVDLGGRRIDKKKNKSFYTNS